MKMKKTGFVLAVFCMLLSAAALVLAQEGAPKPGPEHQKLAFFEGTWTFEGEAKESPMGPAGKVSSTSTCEWFKGDFAIVCRSEGDAPTGPTKELGILTYDAAREAYAYFGIDNNGGPYRGKGSVEGGIWTFTDEVKMGEKSMKIRGTVKETSPTSYDTKLELSMDGGPWMTAVEGSATKKSTT
jgi:hypothetical protein